MRLAKMRPEKQDIFIDQSGCLKGEGKVQIRAILYIMLREHKSIRSSRPTGPDEIVPDPNAEKVTHADRGTSEEKNSEWREWPDLRPSRASG